MNTALDIDVYDSSNRLAPALEKSAPRHRLHVYSFRKHAADKFRPGKNAKLQYCIVGIHDEASALKRIRQLRKQIDARNVRGALAVINQQVASKPEVQRVLFSPGRTHALRFNFEDDVKDNVELLIQNLEDLIRSTRDDFENTKRMHTPYLQASEPIRNPKSHRLDAKLIADYFPGLSLRKLAELIDRKVAAVSKTPDAKRIQEALYPFESILRGRILVDGNDALFKQWLNTPSEEFPAIKGKHPTPMDIILKGHPEVVASMVDEQLTGAPT